MNTIKRSVWCALLALLAAATACVTEAGPVSDSGSSDDLGQIVDANVAVDAGSFVDSAAAGDSNSASTDASGVELDAGQERDAFVVGGDASAGVDADTGDLDAGSPPADSGVDGAIAGPDAAAAGDVGGLPDSGGVVEDEFNLQATAQPGAIRLDWNAGSQQRLRGYLVYRSETAGGPFQQLADVGQDQTSYIDSDQLVVGVTYFYVITSYDNRGDQSAVSNEASAAPEPPPPEPPVAHAGADVVVADHDGDGGEPVSLDASASTDSDGTIVSYEWWEGDVLLSSEASFSHSFSVGEHSVTLTVTDDDGQSSSDAVLITVWAQPIDPGTGAEAIQGYWIWMQVITDGVVTLEITEDDLVWKVGPTGWEGCPDGITCLHYGSKMIAFDDLSNRAHWIHRVTTGSDYQSPGAYAVDVDLVTFTKEERFSCAHPDWDAPDPGVEYTRFQRVGDQLWLSFEGSSAPPFSASPPSAPDDWIVFRQITKEQFHGQYNLTYCGAARAGVESCHDACGHDDVLSLYY